MGLNLVAPCDWYLTEHVFWTEKGGLGRVGGGHSFTQRSKSQTWVLVCVLGSNTILRGLIAVSSTPRSVCPVPLSPVPPTVRQPCRPVCGACRRLGTQVQDCRAAPCRPWKLKQERASPHAGLCRDTSISHIDIIPMFYLSPCNSFYISGLCSLAPVQSQPRDTGL